MNPSTGTFISMDSYQGSIYDPVSLHKYLYANANPVMYTDPSGYATDKNLAETAVAATIAVMLASSVALHNQAMLNIFSTLRKNMADAVMSLPCTVSVTDWKNVILGFPAHEFDTKWLITIPMALSSWQLFKAINDVKEADDEVETPGVPENNSEEIGNDEEETELPKQEGRGESKGGKHEPENLKEKLAMEEVMSNPESGKILKGKNTDPRWPASEGWEKRAKNVNGVEVHYEYNPKTGQIDDVKIK